MSGVLDDITKIYLDSQYVEIYKESLNSIYSYINNEKEDLYRKINKFNHKLDELKEIVFSIRHITAEIYSTCEIINELFILIYRNDVRYRGTNLSNSYNSNFKKVYKAHIKKNELKGVHSDKLLDYFYFQSAEWYIILHDIRTQETHYEIGKIEVKENIFWYKNNNRNGVSKELYTNPSDTIELELSVLLNIIDEFINSQYFIEEMLKKCVSYK